MTAEHPSQSEPPESATSTFGAKLAADKRGSGPSHRRPYEKLSFWLAAVGTAAAIVGTIVAIVQLNQGPDQAQINPPPPPTTACPPIGQPDSKPAAVINLAEPSSPITAGAAAYKTVPAYKIQLEVGGELRGTIPPGKELFLLGRGDPATRDSTPKHNPGDGIYYRSNDMRVVGSCWIRPENEFAYPGAEGIEFRQMLVLVDDSRVSEFTSEKFDRGYDDAVLDSLQVTRLAYFDVPTADLIAKEDGN